MTQTTFDVELWSPLPSPQRIDRLRLDVNRSGLSWSTALPWGFNGCTVAYNGDWYAGEQQRRSPWLDRDATFPWRGHVVVRAGQDSAWEGRIQNPTFSGPSVRGFVAEGYGVSLPKDIVLQSGDTATISGRAVLLRALAACGQFTLGGSSLIADPGVSRAPADFNNHTVAECIDILSKAGDGSVRYDPTCYHNQQVRFLPRTVPSEPGYRVSHDRSVDWKVDYSELFGTIVLTYTTPGASGTTKTISVTNPTFAKAWGGYARMKAITAGVLSDSGARAFAVTWLGYHSVPMVRASVKRDGFTGLAPIRGSSERPWWGVLSGEWVQVGKEAPLVIVGTTADAHAGTLSVQLGEPWQDFTTRVAEYATVVRMVERQRSPVTGALWNTPGPVATVVPF